MLCDDWCLLCNALLHVRGSLFVVGCLCLFVVCSGGFVGCLLLVGCCWLFAVRCALRVVCGVLFVVCW